jgi:hypothetical protein
MGNLSVTHMGEAGVNVDKNALELADNELVRAQNAISDVVVGRTTLRKRAGLIAFNTSAITAGSVLGGSDLPVRNSSSSGIRNMYVGRGPTV